MKKALLKCFAVITLALSVSTVFADSEVTTPYEFKNIPISEAVQRPKMLQADLATYLVVINYTNKMITVNKPLVLDIAPSSAVRITNRGYAGTTDVQLLDSDKRVFYDKFVGRYSILSVTEANGRPVVSLDDKANA